MNLQELNKLRNQVIEKAEKPFEKGGQRAVIGEVREYGGKKYVKHSDGWVYVADGKAHVYNGKITASNAKYAEQHHIDHYHESVNKDVDSAIESHKKGELPKEEVDKHFEDKKELTTSKDHLEESNKWANEISNPTDKSKGMTNSEIDEKSAYHYRKHLTLKDKEQQDILPKIGSSVYLKITSDLPLSLRSHVGYDLKVVGYEKGTLSVPKFLIVEDKKGEKHSLNPNYAAEVKFGGIKKEQPKVDDKPKETIKPAKNVDDDIDNLMDGFSISNRNKVESALESYHKGAGKKYREFEKEDFDGWAKDDEDYSKEKSSHILQKTVNWIKQELKQKEKVGSLDKLNEIKDKIKKDYTEDEKKNIIKQLGYLHFPASTRMASDDYKKQIKDKKKKAEQDLQKMFNTTDIDEVLSKIGKTRKDFII